MKVKKTNRVIQSRLLFGGLVFIAALSSQAGNNYHMNKSIIAGGGGQSSSNGYQLNGVIGQFTATKSESITYQLTAGFYQQNRDLIFFNEFESNQ